MFPIRHQGTRGKQHAKCGRTRFHPPLTLLELADRLRGHGVDDERPEHTKLRWRRRGLRAFDGDAEAKAAGKQETAHGEEAAMPAS